MFTAIINACKNVINRVKAQLKKITKPATATLAISTITDLPRKKSDLIVENAMLRQQLIVLKRSVKRPKLTNVGISHFYALIYAKNQATRGDLAFQRPI